MPTIPPNQQGAMTAAGGGQPTPQTQVAPGNAVTADPQKIIEALKAVIQQSVNQDGYVDMNKLVQLWPQIAQQAGINIPFEVVMQLVSQNPQILDDIITQFGLAGIIANGKTLSSQDLMGMSAAQGGG